MHAYTCACTSTCTCTCAYAYTHAYIHVHIHLHTYISIYVCIDTDTYTYTYTGNYICMYIHRHMHICVSTISIWIYLPCTPQVLQNDFYRFMLWATPWTPDPPTGGPMVTRSGVEGVGRLTNLRSCFAAHGVARHLRKVDLPPGNLTCCIILLWKITVFHGWTHCLWPFSIAMAMSN